MDPREAREQARIDYSLGRYSFWSAIFEPSSHRLVDVAGVSLSTRVLDVAAGDGNTALAAARRGATVMAVDITPAQVRRGRVRTQAEGSTVQWVEGDEDRLPFQEGSFDCALCTFGIEGRLDAAVDEMFRVVRPGGVVGFTEWTGEGFVGALEGLQASFASGREERHDGADGWGNERFVRSRLEARASLIDVSAEMLHCRSESVDRFCADCWRSDPEMRALDQVLSSDRRLAFQSQLRCESPSRIRSVHTPCRRTRTSS
jgi:SAM-dependent methyltransferase